MPTGYTDCIKDGISFPEFALKCARAMGVCITMRDDSLNTPIPEKFIPDNYNLTELEKAKIELEELQSLKKSEIKKRIDREYKENQTNNLRYIKENQELKKKYEDMLEQVRNWQPPTSEHENFKKFMVDQITDSIAWDCDVKYYQEAVDKPKPTPDLWLKQQIEHVKRDIEYHNQRYKEEVERVDSRNKWLKELRESLC